MPVFESIYPLGDSALVVQFGSVISPETHNLIRNFLQWFEEVKPASVIECVPAFTTVTIHYDPYKMNATAFEDLKKLIETAPQALSQNTLFKTIEITVIYNGPDLEYVSAHAKLSIAEVINLHSSATYLVHMIGFLPGFPYLGGMDERLQTPRKSTPRTSVPAGAVGIAGAQTGIYPLTTPGGWQHIGHTDLTLFDPHREQPSLIKAGDHVKFVPVKT